MTPQLQIRTLGGLAIECDGQAVTSFDSRKVQALLVYLACTQHTQPREVLAEMLWEERAQDRALANLRTALTSLRQTVGSFVTITRETVGISPASDIWLDCAAFEERLADAGTDVARLADAVDLYQGDFLAGFYVDSTAFEDWATRERERLRLAAMEGLDHLSAEHSAQGNYREGIAVTTRLLQMDPLREKTHRQLMDLLWRSGEREAALAQYETCRQVLADELGVEPTPETTALYERIKAGETPGTPQPTGIRGYVIREQIGQGSFGEVYLAFQPIGQAGREVAIKVIKPAYANQPDFIRRFEVEAQLIARLEHQNIVPLYDYWREPGGAYLVMRALRESLHTRLQRGPLTVSACVRLVEQVAAALMTAHTQGVIHRDLKPANILLDDDGNAYLTDFGIAKVLGPALHATQEGALVGSPGYLSPEQIRSEPVTAQSDLYSFGVLLYETLTGTSPFSADLAPAALLQKHLAEPLPSLLDARPDLPPALDGVLQQATAKDPAQRFPTALELAAAFRDAAGQAGLRPAAEVSVALPRAPLDRPGEHTWTPADSLIGRRNPYKGLNAFLEADAGDFFGREELVDRLLARLAEEDALSRFLAVVGPSGSGKSSVARAGLLAALHDGALPESEDWYVAVMLPGTHPLDELEIALSHIVVNPIPNLREQLQRDAQGLLRAARMILPAESELFLLIDQFEELFVLADDPANVRHLLDLIAAAVTDPRSRVRVVITLRADFYDRPLLYPEFGDLLRQRTEVVLPLSAEELERAIVGPAEEVGVQVEPALTSAIVAEVSDQSGVLPMLQYALTQLFERHTDLRMTLDAYHDLGGVLGVLAQQADAVYHRLERDEPREAARQLFLRLVTLGEGMEDTRRRTLQEELLAVDGAAMQDVIDVFDRARLVTLDHDPVTRGPTVEVAHEALLREWEQLRDWLDESRHDIRQQRLLAAAAAEWHAADRDRSYLLRGSRLERFAGWATHTDVALTADEDAFLDISITEEERRRTRRRRVRNVILAATIAVATVMTILAIWANSQRNRAEDAEQDALLQASIGLAAQVDREIDDGNVDRAVLLALEALDPNQYPYTSQAESALVRAVEAFVPFTTLGPSENYDPQQYFNAFNTVAWSSDGRQMAMSGDGGQQSLVSHDLDRGEWRDYPYTRQDVESGAGFEYEVVWSPEGTQLLFASHSSPPIILDAVTTETLLEFGQHEALVLALDWSPDGATVITADVNGVALLWNPNDGTVLHTLTEHTGAINDALWSPDATRIATASDDSLVIIWDAATGDSVLTLAGHAGPVMDLAWSPDGALITTAGADGQARVWDAQTGANVAAFSGHSAPLGGIAWSPDGDVIVSTSADGTAFVWHPLTGTDILTWQGLGAFLGDPAWSPDSKRLIFAEETFRIWDVSKLSLVLIGHTGIGLTEAMWSPDGTRIATHGRAGDTRIWDAASGEELLVHPHEDFSAYETWSPDGVHMASPGLFSDIEVWDTTTGDTEFILSPPLEEDSYLLYSAGWSPDGTQIFASIILTDIGSGEVIIWDAATQEIVTTLEAPCYPHRPSWSPDGKRIAAGCAFEENSFDAPIWDVASSEIVAELESPDNEWTFSADWSPDGTRIATSYLDGTCRVWDAASGEVLVTFTGHTDWVWDLAWSPDGTRLLSGDESGVIKIWDATTGDEVRSFVAMPNVLAVNWSPDGTYIIVAGAGPTPVIKHVWQSTDSLIDYAYECCVSRDLTPEEREQFGLPERAE
jgi:WD40 repeat protein/DNA-binding SARP family transcriptional activator